MRLLLTVAALAALTFPMTANAQDYKTLLDIPEGSTLINLSATERVEVEQDLLVANLQFKFENKDPKVVQNEVNKVMKKAMDEAQDEKHVKAKTQQYYVREYDLNRGKKGTRRNMVWRGQQGLQIKGKKADDLLELVGELQGMGLTLNGLNYQVSPELLEETRNSLLEGAMEKLMVKAERTAKAIRKDDVDFLQINVDMGNGYVQPRMYAKSMAMSADVAEMAAPVAAPGESTINMTVSAKALLR